MKTKERILAYLEERREAPAKDIVGHLGISRVAVFRHLADLLAEGRIRKIGRPPKVFYSLKEPDKADPEIALPADIRKVIEDGYLLVTSAGERKEGMAGFAYWCEKNGLPLAKTAGEYSRTVRKYARFRKGGLISGKRKFASTFPNLGLDEVFYLDFYSIERFGKTKLGQILLYAKQSQDRKLIKELADRVRPAVSGLVSEFRIDGIGFIPPTVKREVQLMRELEKELGLAIRKVSITKVKTGIIVPQKTLKKLEDRIGNANDTIIVDENGKFENVLLLDDAVGSGATLNAVANRIKEKGIAKKVIGLAITGSFNGFDVISEV